MRQDTLLKCARLAASLSLFGGLLCTHIYFTLAYFLPFARAEIIEVAVAFFVSAAAGAVLCPLALPVPGGKAKPLRRGIGFIALLVAVETVFHAMGFEAWLGSATVRLGSAIPMGILATLCYGLFYLAWLREPANARANRTGKFCSLTAAAALLGSVLARYYSVPLLESTIAAHDKLQGAAFVYACIQWSILLLGAAAIIAVFLLRRATAAPAGEEPPATPMRTDWPVIAQLVGLASVFTILNAVLNMRMLPLYSDKAVYHPHYITASLAVLALGFLAGRGTDRFIRRFAPPTAVLFILISCLPLFEDNLQVNVFMSTLMAVAHYTAWVVFTTAVVESYAGGFWFYGIATVIFFTAAFAALGPSINRFVPEGIEYRVLFIIIAAVAFMLLAFRWPVFPRLRRPEAASLELANKDNIFMERGLSPREIEVANLLISEGLDKNEIGERLYIAPGTAKLHISKIYQKFGVTSRAEFMSLFTQRENG